MAQKLFRDPVYDYISIDRVEHPWLLDLVNCREVQRLRYISQLGLGHLTYPGSTHSRFAHSLGVMHLMKECLAHLKREHAKRFHDLDEEALLAAALLHDLGHSPFSHATESVFGDHERRTVRLILSLDTEVHKVLAGHAAELPARVAALLRKGAEAPLWQKSLLTSQLDLDRLDYLRRDSLCSGAEYGHFDYFRIIHTMMLQEKTIDDAQKGVLVVWPDKSKYAIEEYLFSRFYMYQSVYFHRTTIGFERLLDRILTRGADLARRNKRFAAHLLAPLHIMLTDDPEDDPSRFQGLTDHVVLAQVTLWQDDKDSVLSDLSRRLLCRRGVGWDEVASDTPFKMVSKIEQVRAYLDERGKESKYYFIEDSPKTTAYRPYSSASAGEEQTSVNSILLFDLSWPDTGFCEITEVPGLDRLKAITSNQPAVLRYYFPKEDQQRIRQILAS